MKTLRYVYWQEDAMWLGYLEEFPDYMSQGETLEELQENLKDIYVELTSGNIPGVRRAGQDPHGRFETGRLCLRQGV